MRRTIKVTHGTVVIAGNVLRKGDEFVGLEHDLKPIVDAEHAEWADQPTPEPKEKSTPKEKSSKKGGS